jgi:predicted Zn-dependent protease
MRKSLRFLCIFLVAQSVALTVGQVLLQPSPAAGSHSQSSAIAQATPPASSEDNPLPPAPATESPTEPEAEAPDPIIQTGGESDDASETGATGETADAPEEVWFQRELLVAADQLYLAGDKKGAEALYREAKTYGWRDDIDLADSLPAAPFYDETQLPPGAAVYWRESTRGLEAGRESQTLIPLALLTEEYPAFIPGHLRYAELLLTYERPDEAETVLEKALSLYPANPDLLEAQVQLMTDQEEWIEASIAARQFALLNPDHPDAEAYTVEAEENLGRFKSAINARIRNNTIFNVITGAAGFFLTGGLFGPFTALNSAMALLQGESAIGEQVAAQAREQLPILEDETVNAYVNQIGQKLAATAGRDEFNYEFYVVLDENLNAFALPGGKVFVNAGAILDTDTEAEFAGLLAHEISHAVLSHGFQMVTRGNLVASLTQYIPIAPDLVTNLVVSGYSRTMERQADIVGTQLLAASGYAADGMHGLMVALEERYGDRNVIPWFSSHPAPQSRVDYLQAIVEAGGYNRYAYEGVISHEEIKAITAKALKDYTGERGDADDDDIQDAVEEVKEEREEVLTDSNGPAGDAETVPATQVPN